MTRTLLMLVDVVVGLVASAWVIVLYVRPQAVGTIDPQTQAVEFVVHGNPMLDFAFVAALLLLACNVLWLMYGRRPAPPLRHVISHGRDGDVRVAREALEAGLRAAGEELDVVTRLRVSVDQGGLKRIVVKSFFHAPDGVSILEAGRRLRHALERRFGEMVHLVDGMRVDFDIEFTGFSGKLARKAGEVVAEEEPVEPEPFTGPRYPIPDDREGRDD